MAILLYINDIIVAGPSSPIIDSAKRYLKDSFRLRNLGPLKFFLGLQEKISTKGIVVSQRQYSQLLEDFGFLDSKPVQTPMNPHQNLSSTESDLLEDITHYRRLIGRLLYLTISKLDIMFLVHTLSQFLHAPREVHLKAAHHLLRYIKGQPGLGLLFLPRLQHKSDHTLMQIGRVANTRRPVTIFYLCFVINPYDNVLM